MPINDYACRGCGVTSEIITLGQAEVPRCKSCGSADLVRLLSAHQVGSSSRNRPGSSGPGCCGSPGSCGSPGGCCSN